MCTVPSRLIDREPIRIVDFAYRVPEASVSIPELWKLQGDELREVYERVLQIPSLREVRLEEVERVPVFDGEPPGMLALDAIRNVVLAASVDPGALRLIVDFSAVSKDANGISLGYRVQNELDARDATVLAIGNGSCVGFQLALESAAALMSSREDMDLAILFAEDRAEGRRLWAPFNVLGDGASAILLRRGGSGLRLLGTRTAVMGRFAPILGVALRNGRNLDFAEFEQRVVPMHYRMTVDLVGRALRAHGLRLEDIALVLYQNMSLNDALGLRGALGMATDRVYMNGLRHHGHVFGSDLVINLCLARHEGRLRPGDRVLLVSSGAGFSWGVSLLEVPQAAEA